MFVGIYLGSAAGLIPSLILTWLLGIFCLRLSRPLTVPAVDLLSVSELEGLQDSVDLTAVSNLFYSNFSFLIY